jgi:zinc/manganese transport system substrate-binding protein
MRRRSLLAIALLAPPALARPAAAQAAPLPAAAQAAPLPVVASFSILADLCRQLGGDRVAVRAIVGPDADAHEFQPRPSDATALRGAALVVCNGLGFEPWLDRMLRAAGGSPTLVTASDGVPPRQMQAENHDHGGGVERRRLHAVGPRMVPDPHAWQDLRFGQAYCRNIAAGLAAADPAGAAIYRANAEAYLARLATLDAWVRAQIATVPAARRKFVTSHDAFHYFGAAYGIEVLAPQGISTESAPSAADVAALIRQLRAEGVTAAFVENMTNPATLSQLAREAGVKIGGRLYADALSPPDGPAPSYEAMFRHNLSLLVPAMRGEG